VSEIITPIITCDHVGFQYGSDQVLRDISLTINQGDYVGLVGGNGSGKTTLLKIVLGLLKQSDGGVKIFDTPVEDFRNWEKIGYVPQNVFRGDLGFPATVREVIESGHLRGGQDFWCRFGSRSCNEVAEAAERAGIAYLLEKRIGELSGGERQRVFIARALVSHPELLVLDEPTTGIDAETEEKFYAFLEELNGAGMTIILVSHDLEAITRQVKTVICLNRRLVCFGKPESLERPEVLRAMYGTEKHMLHHEHTH
jgi:zinc transport system ATP-binding protein